jgi:hypothetical protein
MIRHTKQPTENETAVAKARLRVAALQVTPLDVVREHPWAAVVGTGAGALALAALLGGPPKTKIIYRDRDHNGHIHERHSKEKSSGGLFALLSTGVITKLINAGMQIAQTYMDKKVPPATTGAEGRMNGESGNAVG